MNLRISHNCLNNKALTGLKGALRSSVLLGPRFPYETCPLFSIIFLLVDPLKFSYFKSFSTFSRHVNLVLSTADNIIRNR